MSYGLLALAVRAGRIFTALPSHFDDGIGPVVRPSFSFETIWAVSSTMFSKLPLTSSIAPLSPRLLNRQQAAAYCKPFANNVLELGAVGNATATASRHDPLGPQSYRLRLRRN